MTTGGVVLVMVVHGAGAVAVESIVAVRSTTDAPLLVVDNASPDGAARRIRTAFPDLDVVDAGANLGFGGGIDLAASLTDAENLVALNSDVVPAAGWLQSMLAALDDGHAGAVVPRFVDGDGRLAEAGSLVGRDGRTLPGGVGGAVDDPAWVFRRDVDYGSAAALLVRRAAFDAVGGFDPCWGVGYYEDADLCFRLRAAGWATVLAPAATVAHDGHASFSSRARRAQLRRNRPAFVERHHDQLLGRPLVRRPPADLERELQVRDWWAPTRVLLVGGDDLSPAAAAVADARPRWRVTHVAPRRPDGASDRVERVAVGDLDRWLRRRRAAYDLVVLGPGAAAEAGRDVARRLPAASVVDEADLRRRARIDPETGSSPLR